MSKTIEKLLNSILVVILNNVSKITFSVGVGGILSLYIIEVFRIKVIPSLLESEEIYKLFMSENITSINDIEIYILMMSVISIIVTPLISKSCEKIRRTVLLSIALIIFESILIMELIIHREVSNLFIIGTTCTSIYLVWIINNILQSIYSWIKVDC